LSHRDGFGNVLAEGLPRATKKTGEASQQLLAGLALSRSGESFDYDPRLVLANAISYATEPRRAVHVHHATVLPLKRWLNWTENKWKDAFLTTQILGEIAEEYWGGTESMDFTTYEGKALAAKQIQDYAYIKESLILCDLAWPIYQVRGIDRSMGSCGLESRILEAITGQEWSAEKLIKTGERIYNLQRAILTKQGWGGRKGDTLPDFLFTDPLESTFFDPECLVPGNHSELISRRGAVIDRASFERLKDEYCVLRGWEVPSGLQTKARLTELGLHDVAEDLSRRGLVGAD
jgi:aldehyde:ferredoxin oxidoreductase